MACVRKIGSATDRIEPDGKCSSGLLPPGDTMSGIAQNRFLFQRVPETDME
jgi:hypothetical protein